MVGMRLPNSYYYHFTHGFVHDYIRSVQVLDGVLPLARTWESLKSSKELVLQENPICSTLFSTG